MKIHGLRTTLLSRGPLNVPEPTPEHLALVSEMGQECMCGWYTGDPVSLNQNGSARVVPSRVAPDELYVRLQLSRDRMHHSVGWWRNAEYEYCWHLSMSARPVDVERASRAGIALPPGTETLVALPDGEETYWGRLFFSEHAHKVWHEPGGTDPRLSRAEAHLHSVIVHLRLFLDPETFEPFIPTGEVYDLTRWIDGLTPEKVDR